VAKRYLWVVEKRVGIKWRPTAVVSTSRAQTLADVRDYLRQDPNMQVRAVRYSAEDK